MLVKIVIVVIRPRASPEEAAPLAAVLHILVVIGGLAAQQATPARAVIVVEVVAARRGHGVGDAAVAGGQRRFRGRHWSGWHGVAAEPVGASPGAIARDGDAITAMEAEDQAGIQPHLAREDDARM